MEQDQFTVRGDDAWAVPQALKAIADEVDGQLPEPVTKQLFERLSFSYPKCSRESNLCGPGAIELHGSIRMSNRPRPEDGSPTHVEATQKSIAVLRYLKEEGPATLSELAEALGHSKSTIHRHLRTLDREGFIEETDEGYRVGLLFLDYGVLAQRNHPLYEVAKPKVDELAADTGEKVWCMTEENGLGVFIYHQQGKDVFDTFTRVGYRGRLQDFAAGKAVLAHLPDDRIESILERNGSGGPPGNGSSVEKDRREELRRIRERSVAFNRQESHKGVNAVAAPILLGPRNPLGSISIAGPASRMQGRYFETELPEKLLGITNEIEVQIEYR